LITSFPSGLAGIDPKSFDSADPTFVPVTPVGVTQVGWRPWDGT